MNDTNLFMITGISNCIF